MNISKVENGWIVTLDADRGMLGKQFVFTDAGELGNFVSNQAAYGDLKLKQIPMPPCPIG